MGGATRYLCDPVVLEGGDWLRFAVADGVSIALLAMFIVSPCIHLELVT